MLASLTAEHDKPCQGDGAMAAVIAPDFGVAVLIPRRSPYVGTRQANAEHLGVNSIMKEIIDRSRKDAVHGCGWLRSRHEAKEKDNAGSQRQRNGKGERQKQRESMQSGERLCDRSRRCSNVDPEDSNTMGIAVTAISLAVRHRRVPTRKSIKLLSSSTIF